MGVEMKLTPQGTDYEYQVQSFGDSRTLPSEYLRQVEPENAFQI